MIKESQEQLIEKLANALNQVDSFQVDIEYYIEEGHASIWFSVKDMDTLDLFCNSVKKELENCAFSITYLWYEKSLYRKFSLNIKCGRFSKFKEVVENLTVAIQNITNNSNVVWVNFRRKG